MTAVSTYAYPRFHRQLLVDDLAFEAGPRPGEPLPDFAVTTLDGATLTREDLVGDRPTLVVFASYT